MKPNEFYDCTFKDVKDFIECNSLQREEDYKLQINLFECLGNKLIGALALGNKKPKNISLVKDVFSNLFADEIREMKEKENQPQTVEQQIENLRSWGTVKSKEK